MKVRGGASSRVLFAASVAWLVAVAALSQTTATQTRVNFSRDILPILSDKCFKCHGPDAGSRMADLRLDTKEGALADRDGEAAVIPGKPEKSLIVQRINHPDRPMPPVSSGKTLSNKEKDVIAQWIKEGAIYDRLWSFEPLPAKIPVPVVKSQWPKDDLDRFILDRLNREGLQPTAPASRARWLRRVTLDLTGLPPTEAEITDFEKDQGKDAYEKVVDRLLSSSHFGERLAVEWLDAARYSDSYGYQSDLLMPTWPYRDWVVKSFNENLPYDEFLKDQLAGDLVEAPTRDQVLATAFNRLHRQSNEGGSIALEFKTEYAVDRVSTYGTAMLGLTLGCARCHDHKFDPVSQKEFYQLFAYFNSIDEYGLLLSTEIVPTPSLLLPTPKEEKGLNDLIQKNSSAEKDLANAISTAEPRYRDWLTKKPPKLEVPDVLTKLSLDKFEADKFPNTASSPAFGAKLGKVEQVDGVHGKGIVLDGENGLIVRGLPGRERWDAFTWSFWVNDPRPTTTPVILMHRTGGTDVGFCGFDLMSEDGYLTARVMRHWPGNAVAIRTKKPFAKDKWSHLAWSWDGSGHASGLKIFVDGKPAETTVLVDKIWKKINAYGDLGGSGGDWAFGQRFRDAGFKGGKLDELTFANRALSDVEVAQLFDGTSLQNAKDLEGYYVAAVDESVKAARAALAKTQTDLANFEEGIYEVSVMEEAREEIPAYVLARGQYDAPRTDENKVDRGIPKALPPLGKMPHNDRLALARWTTQPNHPLTARVAVNRLWQMVFGTGLVETSENFGVQGSQPTHPELLDFLARRFVSSRWDVKAALRRMVLSATYRQDSIQTKRLADRDPFNKLYARGPSNRLSAEMLRDTALAASGLLTDKPGGPPVNPYQPAGIWQENNSMSPGFVQSKGADLYRRSLYSTWKRTTPVPNMLLFDATSREACTMRRPATNTPLQALVLLNDIQFVEAARALAELVLRTHASDEDRIQAGFLRLAGREPDAREMTVLIATLKEQRAVFASDTAAAKKLIAIGEREPAASLKPQEVAAMTVTMQTVLNSDSVVWKR